MNDNFQGEQDFLLSKACELLAHKRQSEHNCSLMHGEKCPLLLSILSSHIHAAGKDEKNALPNVMGLKG